MSRQPKTFSRRRLLLSGGALAGATAAFGLLPRAFAGAGAEGGADKQGVRRLTLKNLHTPEILDVVYRRGDQYVPEALAQVEVLLRDYRNGDRHPIEPQLLDILYDVARGHRRRPRVQRDFGVSLAADQRHAPRALGWGGEPQPAHGGAGDRRAPH